MLAARTSTDQPESSCPIEPLIRPRTGPILQGMKTPEAETRRALARLGRAIEKARREVRGLREGLDCSRDDYAEMEEHLEAVTDLLNQEQARQQAKILRAGGIGPARLQRSGLKRPGSQGDRSRGAGPKRSAEPALGAETDGEGGRRS